MPPEPPAATVSSTSPDPAAGERDGREERAGGTVAGLTVTNASLDGVAVGLRCVDGTIEAIGPAVAPLPGDELIDAGGAILMPPFVNGHTHASMTLFRGYGGDLPLMRWLREKVWPVEARLSPEDVYWGTRLACLEMIRNGVSRFWDMYWQPGEVARAVENSGMRATVGGPIFDADGDTEGAEALALESLDRLAATGPSVGAALAPHAIYTVSEGLLRWVAELAAERELAVHIHLSETEGEVAECLASHGLRPAAYLDSLGLLGERTLLAHGVWLDEAELELIAARGATVVTNPVANMKLAVGGPFPYPAARRAGVAVGLGTDGAGSNDSLDPLADLKVFVLLQRHASGDATAVAAAEAVQLLRGELSPLLGATRLEPGAPADFLLLRAGAHEVGLGDLDSALVFAANGAVVDTSVIAGRVLMRGGVLAEETEVVARTAERARLLGIA